jgi:hypothetical protein
MPSKKVVYLTASLAVFLLAAVISYFWVSSIFNAGKNSAENGIINNGTSSAQTIKEKDPNAIDEISWMEPEKIEDFQSFSDGGSSETYKVGEITGGLYKGGEMILSIQPFYIGASVFHLIKKDGDLYLLSRYSDYEPFSEETSVQIVIDPYSTVPALDFPEEISGPAERQTLKKTDQYPTIFSKEGLEKVFTSDKFGDVYTNDGDKPEEYNLRSNAFYIRSPDSLVQTYYYEPDFLADGVPDITWSGGKKNDGIYEYEKPYAQYYYASLLDDKDISEYLEETGESSKGDAIYEIKDPDNEASDELAFYEEYCHDFDPCPISYDEFLASHPIIYYVDPFNRLIEMKREEFIPQQMAEMAKPAIYLYPEEKQTISVELDLKNGYLSKSDPDYGNGWLIESDSSGNIVDPVSGKSYPYLFWESQSDASSLNSDKGFVVKKEDVGGFLSDKLGQLGLNGKEKADFMEFWEPKMQDSPWYFVTFYGNEQMDAVAPLTISPKPDTVIRVLMEYRPLEEPIPVKSYDLGNTPERNGFTVIEWGGVIR